MWLLLSLIASGVAVGLGFLLRYAYHYKLKKYTKLSNIYQTEKTRKKNENPGSEDGYVFICSKENVASYQNATFEDNLDQFTTCDLGSDSDCELIEEIDELVPTSYDDFKY